MTATRRIAAGTLAAALFASAASAAAAAEPSAPPFTVVVQPVSGQPGDYFISRTRAGRRVRAGVLLLRNATGHRVTVLLAPVDALTASNLGSTYKVLGTPRSGATLWTHLAARRVTLAPRASRSVAVLVKVPHGARPGDYLSGISVQARQRRPSRHRVRSNIEIASLVRYAIGVEVRIPGPRHPAVTLTGVALQSQPSGLAFLIGANNTGNAILRNVTGSVLITRGGHAIARVAVGPGTFVTGTSIQYPVLTHEQQVAQGTVFGVRARFAYSGGSAQIARSVTFGAHEASLQQEFGGRAVPASEGAPWAAIGGAALLAAVIGALAGLAALRRRGKRETLPEAVEALAAVLGDPRRAGAPVSVITIGSAGSPPHWRVAAAALVRQRLRPADVLAVAPDGALAIVAPDTSSLTAAGMAEDLRGALARELPAFTSLQVATATADQEPAPDAATLLAGAVAAQGPLLSVQTRSTL